MISSKLGRQLNWKFVRLRASEYPVDIGCRTPKQIGCVDAVRKQAAAGDEVAKRVDRGQAVAVSESTNRFTMHHCESFRHDNQSGAAFGSRASSSPLQFQPRCEPALRSPRQRARRRVPPDDAILPCASCAYSSAAMQSRELTCRTVHPGCTAGRIGVCAPASRHWNGGLAARLRSSPPRRLYAIANGLSGVVDQVKKMTTRIDDDRSRPLVCRVGDDLAGEGRFRPSRLFPRHRKMPALVVPPTQAARISTTAHAIRRTTCICRRGKPPELNFHMGFFFVAAASPTRRHVWSER
jgi:hypothetical protein